MIAKTNKMIDGGGNIDGGTSFFLCILGFIFGFLGIHLGEVDLILGIGFKILGIVSFIGSLIVSYPNIKKQIKRWRK